MNKISTCIAALLSFGMLGVQATYASSVGASGTASIYWNLDTATDKDGNTVDGTGAYTESGNNSLTVSAGVNTYNTISSTGIQSSVYTISNTSTDVFIQWSANFETQVSSGGFIDPDVLGDFYYDANVFLGSAFSSVTAYYLCSILDPNNPNYNCFGVSDGDGDGTYDYGFGSLAPGESVSFTLEGNAFATMRYAPLSAVPLPGAAVLLLSGLAGLGAVRRWSPI